MILAAERIIDRNAPQAVFFSEAAIDEFLDEAVAFDRAIVEFLEDGFEEDFAQTLVDLGYGPREIEEIMKDPAAYRRAGYAMAADYF
jgi:hypothetical protein